MTQVHPGINIGLQQIRNTSEYISKLQLHQHSLLTRKVFSRHNLSAQVFFSISSRSSSSSKSSSSSSHLHLQVIWIQIISQSGSSQNWIWIIIEHHHWIWIITRSGSSSLDQIWIITRSGSSLDLDHHCWIWIITRSRSLRVIITGSGSQLDLVIIMCVLSRHRNFYRASPFSCQLQAYPSCRSSLSTYI